jgi:hypothetical protein
LQSQAAFADVLRFDGQDDLVVVPNRAQLNLGKKDFTMEVVVQTTATNKLSILLSKRSNETDGFIFGIWTDGRLYAQFAGVPNHIASTGNLYDGRCHRVAISRSGPTVTFYVDGQPTGTVMSNRDLSSTAALLIGRDLPAQLSFQGDIGEVRLWDVGRTAAQIAANTPLGGREAGLVGLWEVNSTTRQSLADRSQFTNDGRLGTSAQADDQDPAVVRTTACPVVPATPGTGSLRFDGIDDQVIVPNQSQLNLGNGNFTMEATMQATPSTRLTILLSKRPSNGNNNGFIFGIWSDGRLYTQLAGVPNHIASTGNLYDGRCHRVAITRAGAVVTFYVDGAAISTVNSNSNINSAAPLLIGYDQVVGNSNAFDGQIGEVRLWNVSRTAAQLAATSPLTGTETGLVGLWQMGTSGQIMPDRSTFTNSGLLGTSNQADAQDPAVLQNTLCGAALSNEAPKASGQKVSQAYPNPFTGEFTFIVPGTGGEKVQVRILDSQGRIQYESTNSPGKATLNLGATLKPGMYLLQVTRGGQTESCRVVKLN